MFRNKKNFSNLTEKDIYEEIGRNYRFFLNWRYLLIAGYIVSIGFITKIYFKHELNDCMTLLMILISIVITIFIWLLEIRVRDLYHYCTQCGEEIEYLLFINHNNIGIYTKLNKKMWEVKDEVKREEKVENEHSITHSGVIDLFFGFF